MREIVFFVEDYAHQAVLKALVGRLMEPGGAESSCVWLNVRGGHGAVVRELKDFLRSRVEGRASRPDLVVVATDANCKGLRERTRELREVLKEAGVEGVFAVPDPHIERWLLLDGAAFKAVLGRGCKAPDDKCERSRYKKRLLEAVLASDIVPPLGGIEYAEDIVGRMRLDAIRDPSLKQFIRDMTAVLKTWSTP